MVALVFLKPLIKIGIFAGLLLIGFELAERGRGSLELSFDPLERAESLSADDRHAEARLLANFVLEHPTLGSEERAKEIVRRESEILESFSGKIRRFAQGAATGIPKDTASLLGSLSLDFFVIGDIRDIIVQSYREVRHDDGDKLILALSAVGLATTLAPEIDWAPAMMKSFKRSGSLSPGFSKHLLRMSDEAVKTGKFSDLGKTTQNFAGAARHMGPGPLAAAVRAVDSSDDMAKLSRAAAKDFRGSYVIATGFGNVGVKRIATDGSNIATLVTKIRRSARVVKAFRKSVGIVPTVILSLLFALGLGLLIRGPLIRLITKPRLQRIQAR